MKLPRYTRGASNIAELQAGRNVLRSPEEAARVAAAKFVGLAAVAKTVGDVMNNINDIKAREEFTDAKLSYESALTKLDSDIDQMPLQLDELGNPTYDPDAILKMEADARSSVAAQVRKTLKTPTAKRAFGEYLASSKIQRQNAYASRVAEQSALFIEASIDDKVNTLVAEKNFELAKERASDAAYSGAYGPRKYQAKVQEIEVAEDVDYLAGILNSAVFEPEAAEAAIAEISEGKIAGRAWAIPPERLTGFRNAILSRYMRDDAGQEERIKTAQFANYLALDNDPDLTEEMITQAAVDGLTDPESGISQADYERLKGNLNQAADMLAEGDTPAGVMEFQSEAEELMYGPDLVLTDPYNFEFDVEYNWNERYERFIRALNSPNNGISYNTRKKLQADVNTARNALTSDPEFVLIRRQAIYDVVGFEPDRITALLSSMTPAFKETVSTGNEFARAVTAERLRLGPGKIDKLAEFEKQQAIIYRLKVNNRQLEKVGVRFEWPESGKLDDEYLDNMADQMVQWLIDSGSSAANARTLRDTIDELERINGIQLWSRLSPGEQALIQ